MSNASSVYFNSVLIKDTPISIYGLHVAGVGLSLESCVETRVKQRWARLVLGWVTGWEYRVPKDIFVHFSLFFLDFYQVFDAF